MPLLQDFHHHSLFYKVDGLNNTTGTVPPNEPPSIGPVALGVGLIAAIAFVYGLLLTNVPSHFPVAGCGKGRNPSAD